jgi:hypothetical protein
MLDAVPARKPGAPQLASKVTARDRVEGELEEILCAIEPERLAKVGGVKRVAQEDVEKLASDAPAPTTRGECMRHSLGGAVEARAEES